MLLEGVFPFFNLPHDCHKEEVAKAIGMMVILDHSRAILSVLKCLALLQVWTRTDT